MQSANIEILDGLKKLGGLELERDPYTARLGWLLVNQSWGQAHRILLRWTGVGV